MTIKSHRDLLVWQKAMELVEHCYSVTRRFPDSERYGLTSQIQRAAVSIPANIAEGKARGTTKTFLNHLSIAGGSLAELDTHLIIAKRLGYIEEQSLAGLLDRAEEVGRMLTGLRRSLKAKRS
ncbi:MAG: four helix bundle protein [Planctomycetaceae bacterium]